MASDLTPVTGSDFIGRGELVSEMVSRLSSRGKVGFSLLGIRRVGKTSVLKEVARQLTSKHGIPVIYVSVWRVSPETVDEFVRVLNRASVSAFDGMLPAKFEFEELLSAGVRALARLLQNLRLSAKVNEDLEASVSFVRHESDDVTLALSKSFSLIEDLAKMTKRRCVLMLDEFPSLMELTYGPRNQKIGESIIRLLRTLYEEFESTGLVISGSYRSTIESVVIKQRAAFYRQLLLREVKPFTKEEFEDFLGHYLRHVEFEGGAKDELYRISGAIPYNLQLIRGEVEYLELKELRVRRLRELVHGLLKKEGELLYREYVENLTPSEVKVLRSLAALRESTPKDVAVKEFMYDDTVSYSLNLLMKRGLIERKGRGVYDFMDNLFAEWLKGYFQS